MTKSHFQLSVVPLAKREQILHFNFWLEEKQAVQGQGIFLVKATYLQKVPGPCFLEQQSQTTQKQFHFAETPIKGLLPLHQEEALMGPCLMVSLFLPQLLNVLRWNSPSPNLLT